MGLIFVILETGKYMGKLNPRCKAIVKLKMVFTAKIQKSGHPSWLDEDDVRRNMSHVEI